jgi:hypothetical protein
LPELAFPSSCELVFLSEHDSSEVAMSTRACNFNGIISVSDDDNKFVFEVVSPKEPAGESSDSSGHPMSPDTTKNDPPRKIILGPLPSPPLPTAQLVVTNRLRKARYGLAPAIQLRLDTAFEKGDFSQEVKQEVKNVLRARPQGAPLQINAILPSNHEVDLTLLSRHASNLGAEFNCQIQMLIGTHFVDE